MQNKIKVMTAVGTRPEIIRLSRVISELDIHTDHYLLNTMQNYDLNLNKIFFEDLEIRKPDINLELSFNSPSELIAGCIEKVDQQIKIFRPDAFLVLGDTNSCLSSISAKRNKVPIFHMEAGNRCFDERVPEEINRKIVDHISDINMPYSDISREYLIREGIHPSRIVKTGSPMKEVIDYYSKKIHSSSALKNLKLKKDKFFLVSFHREENLDSKNNLKNIISALNEIAEIYQLPLICSTHPRTRQQIKNKKFHELIQFHDPLNFTDYVFLQTQAKAVLSDSGTITEESSILNFPAINMREAHERPEGMEETSALLSGTDPKTIIHCIDLALAHHKGRERIFNLVEDYESSNVSKKVVRIIMSHIDLVRNKFIKK